MMRYAIPTRKLPERPDLGQLKRQAKELLEDFRGGGANATDEVRRFYHDTDPASFALHDAQLVLARSYGFDGWSKLKAYVDGVTITRLIEAVRAGDVAQTCALLQLRPELINRENPGSRGHTALHYAVMARAPEMVRALMQAGADPYLTTAGIYALREAANPLAIAVERGYDEIAGIIREEAARREAARPAADESLIELHRTLQAGDEDLAIDLLMKRPELLQRHTPGGRWTLLHLASARLLLRTAGWMLEHGADVNRPAGDGSLPLDVAGLHCDPVEKAAKVPEMARLLRGRGAAMTARSAVITGDIESLRALAAETDLIAPQDERGWLLRLAVDFDRPEILKLLLDLGLDPDARVRVEGDDGATFTWGMPLYEGARHGKHALAKILLEHGADPNGEVYASGTPLSEAYGQRDEPMIALLERFGGKSNASMAGLYRRKDLAQRLLREHGETSLSDDGFSKGPVAEQLLGAAARGGDAEILRMAMERVDVPEGDPRWNGILQAPLGFWNHGAGPWCHQEWDRSTYLTCFKMILQRSGPPNAPLNCGATILHQIVTMPGHVRVEERMAFAAAVLDAGARLDQRDDLLKSTPLGWACRFGCEELVWLFLERGADPVEADAEPWARPLAWAEKKGYDRIARLLREVKRES